MPPQGTWYADGRESRLHSAILAQRSNLQNDPAALLSAISDFCKSTFMMVYQPEKIEVSKSILKSMQRKPKVLVELGTYVGTSAVAWGAILKEINGEGDGEGDAKVYSIELDPLFVSIARDFISLAGLDHTVEIVNGQSGTSLKALKDDGKIDAIDVLFLDHWEKFYVEDLKICEDLGLLRVGSVIIADNTDMPGAPDYLEYVRGGGREGKVRYETETVMAGVERGPKAVEVTRVVEVFDG